MTVKRQTVVRNPGTMDKPMIKIANSTLEDMGFEMGTPIEVSYQRGLITIRNLNDNHESNNLQNPASPVTHPASSGASDTEDAGASDGHAGRGEPDPTDITKVVPNPIQPLRYVLTGSWRYGDSEDARTHRSQVRAQ